MTLAWSAGSFVIEEWLLRILLWELAFVLACKMIVFIIYAIYPGVKKKMDKLK